MFSDQSRGFKVWLSWMFASFALGLLGFLLCVNMFIKASNQKRKLDNEFELGIRYGVMVYMGDPRDTDIDSLVKKSTNLRDFVERGNK